ncbi:MAG: hypothetical protein IJW70_06860 [Clostridia bacterium]|nr:hypothetical protein [Clostridia bacterium]
MCLAVVLPTVVLLIYGIGQAKRKQGRFDLILSVLTLLVSAAWMIGTLLNWIMTVARNLIYSFYYELDMAMSMSDLLTILSYLSIAFRLFTTVVAFYLLITYFISVLRSKQKWLQIKAELHKPAAAAVILVPNLLTLMQSLLSKMILRNVELGKMTLDAYTNFSIFFTYSAFALEILLVLGLAIFVLVFGLIIKKQPDTVQDAQSVPAAQAQQPSDIPFNLPAGVNADDI